MKRFALLAALVPLAALVSLQVDPEEPAACPDVDFLTARQLDVSGWRDTYLLFREPNGSYSGVLYLPVPPYTRFSSTPSFNRRFTDCLPAIPPARPPAALARKPLGAGASPVFADRNFLGRGRGLGAWPHYSRDSVTVFVESGLRLLGARREYFVGENPQAVAGGDYDRDGHNDLLAVYSGGTGGAPGGVAVLRGAGDGTFSAALQTQIPDGPIAFAQSDLNGDGLLDLVIALSRAPRVEILTGQGDGRFTAAGSVETGNPPLAVTLSDIDGDGRLDLLVADPAGVSLFPAAGAAFGAPTSYAAGPSPSYIAVADFNQDGRPDLAVASRIAGTASILLGAPAGRFGPPHIYAIGTAPLELVVTDFNADGALDLVAGGGAPDILTAGEIGGYVAVLLGRGDGSFLGARSFPVDRNPTAAAVADLNADGRADIVSTSGGSFSVLLNDGRGAFDVSRNPVSARPADLLLADFNQDALPDLVLADASGAGLLFLPGSGNGSFAPSVRLPLGPGSTSLTAADFNGDGVPDIAAVAEGPFRGHGDLAILLGTGGGAFAAGTTVSLGSRPTKIVSGDWNRDGAPDLAVVESGVRGENPGAVRILHGDGDGGFQTPLLLTGLGNPIAIAAGDLNADGFPDLAVTTATEDFRNRILLFFGQPGGGFPTPVSLRTEFGPVDIVLADFNGDARLDMVIAHCCGEVAPAVRAGNGDGTFTEETPFVAGNDTAAFVPADLDGDGRPDLAALNAPATGPGGVTVLTNFSPAPGDFVNVSAASFERGPLAPGSIVTAAGTDLAAATAAAAGLPLPENLGDLTIAVRDYLGVTRNAGIYFVSPGQVNYVLPAGAALGPASVLFRRPGAPEKRAVIQVRRIAPALFFVNADRLAAALVLRVRPSGEQLVEPVARFDPDSQSVVPAPIDLGPADEQVFLELFGVGIRGRKDQNSVRVTIAGAPAEVLYAGDQGGFPGMDQVNARLARSLAGAGLVKVVLEVEEESANAVWVEIQ